MDRDILEELLRCLRDGARLKDAHRLVYTSDGRAESAAAHTWRVCLMALVLEERFPKIDFERLVKIRLVHELGQALEENRSTPRQNGEVGTQSEEERRALFKLVGPLPEALKKKIVTLWDEYQAAETPEARLAKGLGQLETLLEYVQGGDPPDIDL